MLKRRRRLPLFLRAEFALLLLAAAPALAGTRQVKMTIKVPPELHLLGTEKIFIGPVMVEPRPEQAATRDEITTARELEQYIRGLLRRETRLNLLPPRDDLRPPTNDISQLAGMKDCWSQLASETGADYTVSASIDVDVLDRTGYRTEQYVSPEDGKTYFRQVLVEDTGFNLDVLLMVFNREGDRVLERQITDFQPRPERKLNEFKDMFDELYNVENRLVGIFVPRTVPARRYLYTD